MTTQNEYLPHGTIRIDCGCCELPQVVRDRDGAEPTMCDECYQHQGQLPERRLTRAESHEAMLRVRLTACTTSEQRTQRALEDARARVAAALESRGNLADRLVSAAEGSARHRCEAMDLGREPYVVDLARKHRERRDDPWGR